MIFEPLRKLFRAPSQAPRGASVPPGERYYLVGDIHGRLDLFEAIIDAIEEDNARAGRAVTSVILLGDLVDRGADSAGVLRRAREWQTRRRVRILAGNHEEMFLDSFNDIEVLRHFLKHGGRETILSYGIAREEFNRLTLQELFDELPKIVPQADRDYIAAFEEMIVAGDYLFVHAGIDPSVPLSEQQRKDMLWIRDRFLKHKGPFEKVVIHGHTIFDQVMDCGHRIGIDTGAFRTGVLSALVLEGVTRRSIQAVETDGKIEIVEGDF